MFVLKKLVRYIKRNEYIDYGNGTFYKKYMINNQSILKYSIYNTYIIKHFEFRILDHAPIGIYIDKYKTIFGKFFVHEIYAYGCIYKDGYLYKCDTNKEYEVSLRLIIELRVQSKYIQI